MFFKEHVFIKINATWIILLLSFVARYLGVMFKSPPQIYIMLLSFRRVKNLVILSFLVISNLAFSQDSPNINKISNKVSEIVSDIAKGNVIDSSGVGIVGTRTEQYDYFSKLVKLATSKELLILTDHPNAAVRGYAFWALSFDHSIDLFPIINKHLNDEERVGYVVGCNANASKVGDFFINIVNPKFSMNPTGKGLKVNKFTPEQLHKLDQLLLTTPNNLDAKVYLFSKLKPNPKIYARVRDIVSNEEDPIAAILLAKYKKESDVSIILKAIQKPFDVRVGFGYSIQAIQEFPHPDFFPVLEAALKSKLSSRRDITGWSDELIRTIVSYHNYDAIELLQTIFMLKESDYERKIYLKRIMDSLSYLKNPIYDDMLWKLWREEQLLSQTGFEYLSEKDPEKTFTYAKQYFVNIGNDSLDNAMIAFLLPIDRKFAIVFIKGNIMRTVGSSSATFYADKVAELQDKELAEELLLQQLDEYESADDPQRVLHAAKILLAYKNDVIKQKVLIQINKIMNRIKEKMLLPYENFLMEED